MTRLAGLHVIAHRLDLVRAAVNGGAAAVQLREKAMTDRPFFAMACEARAITREAGVTLIVDDRVDVALAVGADGVHLGEHDLPLEAVHLLAPHLALGASCYGIPEVARAEIAAGASYLGVGAIFRTSSKETRPPIGLDGLRRIRAMTDVPLVAIGGITAETAAQVIKAGADSIAVIGAVANAPDPEAAVRALVEVFDLATR